MEKIFLSIGAFSMAVCVGLGAFGAHALRNRISDPLLGVFQTGVQYHVYHSLGLLCLALAMLRIGDIVMLRWSGILMIAGIFCFSGSLYALALGAPKGIGIVTPIGGAAFIGAWVLFALGVFR